MEQFEHISVDDAKRLINEQGAVLADIRDDSAYQQSHVPGAIHLTNQSLMALLEEVAPETPVIVMCYHGISSQSAAQYLLQQGLDAVYSLDGGYEAWVKQADSNDEKR
ncbi:thiosulfate sulfurtransferase GlpE [Celerinatantimonas yamalensis]|uniref:Thiosulfate sulfurtransferase GlpE n=1 Tax=Celerinatantimonas yamalensis TaxID=559956 RepID=A0ABW9G8Z3_9GAMM